MTVWVERSRKVYGSEIVSRTWTWGAERVGDAHQGSSMVRRTDWTRICWRDWPEVGVRSVAAR